MLVCLQPAISLGLKSGHAGIATLTVTPIEFGVRPSLQIQAGDSQASLLVFSLLHASSQKGSSRGDAVMACLVWWRRSEKGRFGVGDRSRPIQRKAGVYHHLEKQTKRKRGGGVVSTQDRAGSPAKGRVKMHDNNHDSGGDGIDDNGSKRRGTTLKGYGEQRPLVSPVISLSSRLAKCGIASTMCLR